MVFPEVLGEDFVDEVVGIVLVHLDLFQNDAALAGDVGLVSKTGFSTRSLSTSMRDGQVLIEHLHVEADALLGGEGVEVAADGIDLPGDVFGAARLWCP